jgi:hypothetical protein
MLSGHGEQQPVALRRRDQREPDPGVAAGRLHDLHPGAQRTGRLGVLNHRGSDPVLDATAGVRRLQLGDQPGRHVLAEAVQLDEGGTPDQAEHVAGDVQGRVLLLMSGDGLMSVTG